LTNPNTRKKRGEREKIFIFNTASHDRAHRNKVPVDTALEVVECDSSLDAAAEAGVVHSADDVGAAKVVY